MDWSQNWYLVLNRIEAVLWFCVAAVLLGRMRWESGRQKRAVLWGAVAFVAFGMTDLLEATRAGSIPLWLWLAKIACGVAILVARFSWLGWDKFRWNSREVIFGLLCLLAVLIIMQQQFGLFQE